MSCLSYFLFFLASFPLLLLSSSCLFSCDLDCTYFKLSKFGFSRLKLLFLHKCIWLPVPQQYLILENSSGLKFYLFFIPPEGALIPSCKSSKDTKYWMICAWLLPYYSGDVLAIPPSQGLFTSVNHSTILYPGCRWKVLLLVSFQSNNFF